MTVKRVRGRTAESVENKCTSKNRVVTKVNYIKGTRKSGMGTYSVTTKKRENKA